MFKKILAILISTITLLSLMTFNVFAENKVESSNILFDLIFNTSLDTTETMVYNSATKPVNVRYLKVWVDNKSDNIGMVYVVQTDGTDCETGKSILAITSLIPNKDNQTNTVDMFSVFGKDYAKYRYKIRIEGKNNETVCGNIVVEENDNIIPRNEDKTNTPVDITLNNSYNYAEFSTSKEYAQIIVNNTSENLGKAYLIPIVNGVAQEDKMIFVISPVKAYTDNQSYTLNLKQNFPNITSFRIVVSGNDGFSLSGRLTVKLSNTLNNAFNDISGHWAESTINKWANYGIISGYPDGTFKPDSPVTRAELAKILTLAFDLQPSEFIYNDRDLSEDTWYYNYLLCAGKYIPNYALPEINKKNQPYVDNRMLNAFLPEQNAMRMHVAESLVEIKRNKEQSIIDVPDITVVKEELNKTFKDADYEDLLANHGMIPENVRRMFEYTYLAKALDIMQGDTDGYFRPYDNVTRAEVITMLDRIIAE